jgi:hypothetical protein
VPSTKCPMIDLFKRLRNVEIKVLAPEKGQVSDGFGEVAFEPAYHRSRLEQIRLLRKSAGGEYSTGRESTLPRTDTRDEDSWHLMGIDPSNNAVVGAIRIRLYSLQNGLPSPAELFDYSDVRINDLEARQAVAQALAPYVSQQAERCGYFYQVGGFVVSPSFRGSALAPLLALATNAWTELLGVHGGCTFATVESGIAAFYKPFGAFPFATDTGALAPFFCEYHQAPALLLSTEPHRYETRLTHSLNELIRRFRTTPVVTPA